ncbi:MAG TPA: helix-turn-helix domain-containing protein [Leptospiraceae bacterium]|nr:helix-turn-helix domain-containing protein [Leptospiraceae bacterium]
MFAYELHRPASQIRNYIQNYHFIQGSSLSVHQRTSCLSNVSLIINYGDEFHTVTDDNIFHKYANGIYTAGMYLHPRNYGKLIPDLRVIVVDFAHEFLNSVFRENMELLTNSCIEIQNFRHLKNLYSLTEKLSEAENSQEKLNILNSTFAEFFCTLDLTQNEMSLRMMDAVNAAEGNISIRDLSRELDCSERTLRRKSIQAFGVSPVQYIRTVKAEFAIARLLFDEESDMQDLVFDFGYYDQSHFIHDVQSAISLSPGTVRKIRHLPEMQSLRALLRHRHKGCNMHKRGSGEMKIVFDKCKD